MLMQNFKTPAELGLDSDAFDAMVKVLGMLERDELIDISNPDTTKKDSNIWLAHGFNMGCWNCGTTACIGGWVEAISGICLTRSGLEYNGAEALLRLFYPGMDDCKKAYSATTAQAAVALRNYLRTGEPNWAEAMSSGGS